MMVRCAFCPETAFIKHRGCYECMGCGTVFNYGGDPIRPGRKPRRCSHPTLTAAERERLERIVNGSHGTRT